MSLDMSGLFLSLKGRGDLRASRQVGIVIANSGGERFQSKLTDYGPMSGLDKYVCREILGIWEEEYAELKAAKVLE